MQQLLFPLVAAGIFVSATLPAQVDVTASGGTPAQSYSTLGAAFSAINGGTHTGIVGIALSGDTDEGATSAVLNRSGSGGASYTGITIQPSGGAPRTVTASIAAGPTIDLNGADNVLIDGLNSGGNSLTIVNTAIATGPSTIRFQADATGNTVTRCSILGSATSATGSNGGNIWFAAGALATGNDNNTISHCNIGPAGANLPTKGIYFTGTTTNATLNNSGIVITGNQIFDCFSPTVNSAAIDVNNGSIAVTLSNNRIYQTASRTLAVAGLVHSGIRIANTGGTGYLVSGNTIGFASSTGTGSYTLVFPNTTTGGFVPVNLSVGTASVQGNTIAGIVLSGGASGNFSNAPFRGIYIFSGLVTVGDVAGNLVGSLAANDSITFTSTNPAAAGADVIAIHNFGSSGWTVLNNQVGGITVSNSSTGPSNLYGIRANTLSSVTFDCRGNTIGGPLADSLRSTTTAANTTVQGIACSAAAATIAQNLVRNLTANGGTGSSGTASVIGINVTANGATHSVTQNLIHSLANTGTSNSRVTGLEINTTTAGTSLFARNFIHSFSAATAGMFLHGIHLTAGNNTVQNNFVRLGIDAAGNPVLTGCEINGLRETTGSNSILHNSVYLGGSSSAVGTVGTYAFHSAVTTNARSFLNNIFVNARLNTGSGNGKHYAIRVGGSAPNPAGLTVDYNVYLASGTGGIFGFFNGADVANLSAWRAAVGQDGQSLEFDPGFLGPTGNAASVDLHIHPALATVIERNGLALPAVTDDFDGEARGGLTPVDIGADAGNYSLAADFVPPTIVYTPLGNWAVGSNQQLIATITDNGTGVPISGLGLPRLYFRINGGPLQAVTALSLGNSQYRFTFGSGTTAPGDQVSYFVVAQDMAAAVRVSANPAAGAGAFTFNPPAAGTPPTTPNVYTAIAVTPPIAGTLMLNVEQGRSAALALADIVAACSDPGGLTPLTVIASGPNSAQGGVAALGPTAVNYQVPSPQFTGADSFNYFVQNTSGGISMGTVNVTVLAPPFPPGPVTVTRAGSNFAAGYQGVPGLSYAIEFSNDLLTAFAPLLDGQASPVVVTADPNGAFSFSDPTSPNPQRFYRARAQP